MRGNIKDNLIGTDPISLGFLIPESILISLCLMSITMIIIKTIVHSLLNKLVFIKFFVDKHVTENTELVL